MFWNKAVAAFIGAAVSDVWFRIMYLICMQCCVSRCSDVESDVDVFITVCTRDLVEFVFPYSKGILIACVSDLACTDSVIGASCLEEII